MSQDKTNKMAAKKAAAKKAASKTSSTASADREEDSENEALYALLKASEDLIKFHRKSDDYTEDDLRIYWDVRVLCGKGEVFALSKGQSSLPGALHGKAVNNLNGLLQHEIAEKIASPIAAKCMSYSEDKTADENSADLEDKFSNTTLEEITKSDAVMNAGRDA